MPSVDAKTFYEAKLPKAGADQVEQPAGRRSHLPVAKRDRLAMRICSGALAAVLMVLASWSWAAQPTAFDTPEAAFEQGVAAYNTGAYAVAVPALSEAALKGNETARFFAEFYLARIYADLNGGQTNPSKAYMLYRKIADEYTNIDPDDDHRAPFVAKAMVALAAYAKQGLPDLNMAADSRRAVSYLHHAALFFGDKEAQFELAKLYLSGDGSRDDVRRGLHYLATLSEQSYPAAQALLAEQLWTGQHVKTDQRRALALITMAAESAPAHDRMWIEDVYHSMFCAASQGTRSDADGLMARWRRMFARPTADAPTGLGNRETMPDRQCSNGEAVAIRRGAPLTTGSTVAPATGRLEVLQGSTLSLGYRAANGPPDPSAAKK